MHFNLNAPPIDQFIHDQTTLQIGSLFYVLERLGLADASAGASMKATQQPESPSLSP